MRRLVQELRWYLREVDGRSRWERYLAECAAHGHPPLTRREFERRRADARAGAVSSRCC
ncbi:YbdD/YjiX family protein [Paenibacillus sp. TRM 82003]|uniref:CstA-like transporter-associated (seleno)protein n=1 Tax=Kineococcus sp. TRM81007 TaxID=2925831 RepID=UPI001F56AF70|nr:CstA-like transporter-associated (seleno)protein [Kineococcus sp. TRM81007]MCI2240509.1 YbdD/YjiX family protein [Kineococcus sp. TRM81007]MCI3925242.1 YbdD/YjiX family protein [Paenibacillus sp. TRM 82003]